jgi:hypothetical protein
MDEAKSSELDQLYRTTDYVVRRDGEDIVIRIGEHSPAVDELLTEGPRSWAFLTAWNPYSRELTAEENARRQNELIKELNENDLRFLHGAGQDREGRWPPEQSLLIFGIDLDSAVRLAKKFEQNAIVFGRHGEPAELVWCA